MPTTYTHDLFGKLVYKKLPSEMKRVIREHGDLYRIGLHGPDIFFYQLFKGKVNRFGVQMHRKKANVFFTEGMKIVREQRDEALLAYLLGFGCHYLLDSACHPFVQKMAEEGVITHTLLEKEWDRELLIETGKDPLRAHPADALVPKREYAEVIGKVLPQLSTKDIYHSLKMQKFLLNRMVYGERGTIGKIVHTLLAFSGNHETKELADHFMNRDPSPKAKEPVFHLKALFAEALEEAPKELEQLFALSHQESALSERWNRTYNGG